MKKIIILKDNGGRLANQLWVFASVYSYCLKKKYDCSNYAFFRYQKYFDIYSGNIIFDLFFRFHTWHKNYRLSKALNYLYYKIIKIISSKNIILDHNVEFDLPPSLNDNIEQKQIIDFVDNSKKEKFYFVGWLFRNPEGLIKYHNEIKKYFRPKEKYYSEIFKLKNQLKEKYKLIVGVHIRQGDYTTWQGGKFFFSCQDVSKILNNFLQYQTKFNNGEIVFVLCSDGPIEKDEFGGLNIVLGPGSEITDLYMLAESDFIIGSNSTYGSWASYYGSIPFLEFSKNNMDWSKLNF